MVAYIYESIPITREDLGEYLIARKGLDHDRAVGQQKDYRARLPGAERHRHRCRGRGVDPRRLRRRSTSRRRISPEGAQELRQDAVRVEGRHGQAAVAADQAGPRPHLKPTDDELHKAFDAAYGEKRDCRIIIWPKDRLKIERRARVRHGPQERGRVRSKSPHPGNLAPGGDRRARSSRSPATAGVHPKKSSRQPFTLQPGEVSRLNRHAGGHDGPEDGQSHPAGRDGEVR